MDKLYALISKGWDDNNGITGRCLGVFSSSELAVKAANDYLKKISNNEIYNIEGLILPNNPLTFDMLDASGDGYEYLNNNNMYRASLYIDIYDLNRYYFY